MVHCASWLLVLGAIVVVFSTSNAWFWRRRRRSCSAVSCRVSSWSSWSYCSRTCGSGVKTRTRTKTRSASCGGTCPYDFTDTKRCNSNCCPVNCVYSWGSWSSWMWNVDPFALTNHIQIQSVQRKLLSL